MKFLEIDKMNKTITYTTEERLSRNIRDEDFTMFDEEGNTNFYIIETMDCDGELGNSYEVFMGKKLFNYYKTIKGAKIGITKTFAQDENGNGLIPRDEINIIIVETVPAEEVVEETTTSSIPNLEARTEKVQDLVDKAEKFGKVLLRDYDAQDLENECWDEIRRWLDEGSEHDEDIVKAYHLTKKLRKFERVTFFSLVETFNEICHEGRYGANHISGVKLIPFVETINAIYCVENPTRYSNKVAFSWNNAFNKNNPRAYMSGCIRNYLKENNVEISKDEAKMIVGLKQDPMYTEWIEVRRYQ